ncbi:Uncharacterised protein [Mycobacteroides abscessus subsp. massiliense]|nr:Uncharacterised protein [Mycobacteroides abscessus subsp. massiliense]
MDFGRVDDVCHREFVFQLGDSAFDKALTLFGGFVFCVFRQVAVRTCFGDGFDDFWACYAFEVLKFLFQQFCTTDGQRDFLH